MDRYDYAKAIVEYLRGRTGMNFQKLVRDVLKEYNNYLGNTYEMPDAYGGDKKNDGWVVETSLFYQIYAPARNNTSLKKNMQKKFTEDLTGLLENVCRNGLWNGEIKEFIYLVNTFDNDLPEDSERYYEHEALRLQKEYSLNFKYKVVNLSYVYDVLCQINDLNVLEKISALINVKGMIDYNAVSEEAIFNLIMKISMNISLKYINTLRTQNDIDKYDRISTVKKITVNSLDEKQEDIEMIISNLDVVERAVTNINQDIMFENRFERVKELVIDKYDDLAKKFQGVILYQKLIEEIVSYVGMEVMDETSVEFLVVYIFDKCDIFEKE
ncbi:hypothetical protein ACTQ6A_15640 [Lachnospiraceae bacterium LCP25S3_G4]